jgi:uncharacterized membrane protein
VIRLRRYVVAGLLVWLPVGATILVFRLLLNLMDRLLFWLPAAYRPDALIDTNIPGLNAIVSGVLAFLLLAGTGVLAANFLGKRLVSLYESVLAKIPFVRTVYGGVKNFAEVLFSDNDDSFKRVLLIEYPRKGLYCLVFQTSENASEVQMRTGETVISVFLPTTPNPTSGFILFVPKKDAVELSLGVVVPAFRPGGGAAEPVRVGNATLGAAPSTAGEGLPGAPDAVPAPASAAVGGPTKSEPRGSTSEQGQDVAGDRPELARPKAAP